MTYCNTCKIIYGKYVEACEVHHVAVRTTTMPTDLAESYVNLARTVDRILNPRESPYGGTLTDYAQPVHIAEIGRAWLELRKVENK